MSIAQSIKRAPRTWRFWRAIIIWSIILSLCNVSVGAIIANTAAPLGNTYPGIVTKVQYWNNTSDHENQTNIWIVSNNVTFRATVNCGDTVKHTVGNQTRYTTPEKYHVGDNVTLYMFYNEWIFPPFIIVSTTPSNATDSGSSSNRGYIASNDPHSGNNPVLLNLPDGCELENP